MYTINLVCPNCGLPISDITKYTKEGITAKCNNCGLVEWLFENRQTNNHKPQEIKRKLTAEKYFEY